MKLRRLGLGVLRADRNTSGGFKWFSIRKILLFYQSRLPIDYSVTLMPVSTHRDFSLGESAASAERFASHFLFKQEIPFFPFRIPITSIRLYQGLLQHITSPYSSPREESPSLYMILAISNPRE
jgi:hypothetical protein